MRWLDGITDSIDMFEQTLGDNEGQGSLAYCSPWDHKESDMTQRLNKSNTEGMEQGVQPHQEVCTWKHFP